MRIAKGCLRGARMVWGAYRRYLRPVAVGIGYVAISILVLALFAEGLLAVYYHVNHL